MISALVSSKRHSLNSPVDPGNRCQLALRIHLKGISVRHNNSSLRDYSTGWTDSRSPKRTSKGLRWALLGSASGLAIGLFSLTSFDANALRIKELPLSVPGQAIATETANPSLNATVAETRQVISSGLQTASSEPLKGEWHDVTVREGDSLARIFSQQKIPASQLHRLIAGGGIAKKLTRIYPGQTIRLRTSAEDGLLELKYEIDALNQIKVTREGDTFDAQLVTRVPERRRVQATGEIDSSLFLAAQKARLPENIAMELAGVFGWDIDFALDIRKGDRFTVLYEDLYLDGDRVGTGNILAAEFINRNKTHQAVRYTDARGRTDYYSPKGRSMRKTFLRTPVAFSRISSRFSLGRKHPILNTIRSHKGVDYAAPRGTPVKATGSGKIVLRGRKGGYGKAVVIQHGSRYNTLYAHLNSYARGLRNGSRVQQGQVIGYVGSTGLATGPHLHYEFRVNGVHRNPLTVKLPDAAPLQRNFMADFKLKTENLLARLELAKSQAIALQE
ncbi:Peptidase, M23/M37 family [hydrothermal vent metagenome]|uniref:Peptidase, M23/M37 family n=1 Tax=hydrothermal vent metagenome TaxID=652676 RepID=A0A3B0Y869_9ZZZZ